MLPKSSTKAPKRSFNPLISIIKSSPQQLKAKLGIYAICMQLGCLLCLIGTGATLAAGVPYGWCFFLSAGFIIIIVSLFLAHRRNMDGFEPSDPVPGKRSYHTSTPVNRTITRKKQVRKRNDSDLNRKPVDHLEIKLQPAYDRYRYYEQPYSYSKRRIRRILQRILQNCPSGVKAIAYMLKLVYSLYFQRRNMASFEAIDTRFRSTVASFLGEVSSLYTVHKRINRADDTSGPGYRSKTALATSVKDDCDTAILDQQCSQPSNLSCTEELSIKTDKVKSYVGNRILHPNTLLICQFYLN